MGEAFDISLLRNMRRLEELYLYVPGIRSRLDSVAECCPKLEVLECHGCGVTDEVIENLHRLTSIRRIELSSNPITDESSGVLSKSEGVVSNCHTKFEYIDGRPQMVKSVCNFTPVKVGPVLN